MTLMTRYDDIDDDDDNDNDDADDDDDDRDLDNVSRLEEILTWLVAGHLKAGAGRNL